MKALYLAITLCSVALYQTSVAQYINNQTGSVQSATFTISGDGRANRFFTNAGTSSGGLAHMGFYTGAFEAPSRRWNFGLQGDETGSTAGSNFTIWSYDDEGTYIHTPFSITRSNGFIGLGTQTPTARLEVRGNINVFNPSSSQSYLSLGSSETNRWSWMRLSNADPGSPDGLVLYENNTGIGGSAGTRICFAKGGSVGIGTVTPAAKLQVTSGGQSIQFVTGTNTSGYILSIGANDDGVNFSSNSSVRGFNIKNANGMLMAISPQGNVAIGTTDAKGYKLAVNGDAVFTKVKVKANANWPDFVFEETYKLPSLQELEFYLKRHKHLPGIPSAEEVMQNGVDLGEMNAKLLQKIEELTLHLIEMKKEMEVLKEGVRK